MVSDHQSDPSPKVRQLPFAVVLLIVAAGFERIIVSHWREGSLLIGGALLLAAALRTLVRDEQAGLLAIRHRVVDVFCYSGLGLMLIYMAATIKK